MRTVTFPLSCLVAFAAVGCVPDFGRRPQGTAGAGGGGDSGAGHDSAGNSQNGGDQGVGGASGEERGAGRGGDEPQGGSSAGVPSGGAGNSGNGDQNRNEGGRGGDHGSQDGSEGGDNAPGNVAGASGGSGEAGVGGRVEPNSCGDGVRLGAEADSDGCDDDNLLSGDGCNDSCRVEIGWTCSGEPSECEEICGDGREVGVEAAPGRCDDGNRVTEDCAYGAACDVCDEDCNEGPGIRHVCGDDVVDAPYEECDEGSFTAGDGCSDTCQYETPSCGGESVLLPREALSMSPDGTGGKGLLASYSDGSSVAGEGPLAFGPHWGGDVPSFYPAHALATSNAPVLWRTIWGTGGVTLTGYFKAPITGRVAFHVGWCDDYCNLQIGDDLTILADNTGGADGEADFVAGEWYPITLVYQNRWGSNGLNLWYSCPSLPPARFENDASTVGLWRFDETAGTLAVDAAPDSLHGTLVGATWVDGTIAGGLQLGPGARVEVPLASALIPATNQVTVEAHLNISEGATGVLWDTGAYTLYLVDGRPRFSVTLDDQVYTAVANDTVGSGWIQLGGSFDGVTLKVTMSGIVRGLLAAAGTIGSGDLCASAVIGASCSGGNELDGLVDDLRISDTARY